MIRYLPDSYTVFILYTVARMDFRELRPRNGHKARGMVEAVEASANVNRHQGVSLRRTEYPRVSGILQMETRQRDVTGKTAVRKVDRMIMW